MKTVLQNGDSPANPVQYGSGAVGLTKRELIAAMALQGFAARHGGDESLDWLAASAVQTADALLEQLAKNPEGR